VADQQRHGLPLHIRTHQRTVRVVMFEDRNQTSRHADHLARSHVDVFDLLGQHDLEVGTMACD
jgi:hypothetical protein